MCRRSRKKKKKIEAKPRTCIFPKVFLPLPVSLFLPFLTSFCCRPICPRLPRGYRRQLIAVWFSLFSMSSFLKKSLCQCLCPRQSLLWPVTTPIPACFLKSAQKERVWLLVKSDTHEHTYKHAHTDHSSVVIVSFRLPVKWCVSAQVWPIKGNQNSPGILAKHEMKLRVEQ